MLKSYNERIVVNDFVQGEPLSEENLNKTLNIVTEFNKRYRTTQDIVSSKDDNHNMLNENVDKIRLLMPEKTIWLYSGYAWEETMSRESELEHAKKLLEEVNKNKNRIIFYRNDEFKYKPDNYTLRQEIISRCDVLIDGRYIDSQRDVNLSYRGSKNQRVIDIQKSLEQNEVILWTT